MNKATDRRTAILDRLADHVLSHGLIASSLRPLAQAAGTSDRMLLYYFADKAEIMAATLEVVATRMQTLMAARMDRQLRPYAMLLPHMAAMIGDESFWPYMRVWLEIASRAAGGDSFYRSVGEQIGRGFLAWGASQLDSPEPDADAANLLVAIEGMVLLKAIGLDDVWERALG